MPVSYGWSRDHVTYSFCREFLLEYQPLADPGVWKGGPYGEREARAYDGGLGTLPPVGSRGKAPG